MKSKKAKIFVLCGMVALLVATGVLNIVLNYNKGAKGDDPVSVPPTITEFFADFRSDREATRAESILMCDAIINDGTSSAEAIASAETLREFYVSALDIERTLETLIKAAGFADVAVTTTTENVNIILKAAELTAQDVGRVLEIVQSETGKKANNVRVIPVA